MSCAGGPNTVVGYSVVIPTVGRPSLDALLTAIAAAGDPAPAAVVVVDDRPAGGPLTLPPGITYRRSGARGPAAARNVGWQACDTDWIVFLDDDVVIADGWPTKLADDLTAAAPAVAAVQARIEVPLPTERRATDWERGTAGLARARWITADLAVRRSALQDVGGFDERFPRAFREDADLALRLLTAGYQLLPGHRRTVHPVRPADWWISVRLQRGNADDALMHRLHGRGWYARAGAHRGLRVRHHLTTLAALATLFPAAAGRRRAAAAGLVAWIVLTGAFAARRIVPGPRTLDELARMLLTSVAIPPAATAWWLLGRVRHRAARPWTEARCGT